MRFMRRQRNGRIAGVAPSALHWAVSFQNGDARHHHHAAPHHRRAVVCSTVPIMASSRRYQSSADPSSLSSPPSVDEVRAACRTMGVDATTLSSEVAKKKFLQLAKEHHPDAKAAASKAGGGPASSSSVSMADINGAYAVLQRHFKGGGGTISTAPSGSYGSNASAAGRNAWGWTTGGPSGSGGGVPPQFHQAFWEGFDPSQFQSSPYGNPFEESPQGGFTDGSFASFDPREAFAAGLTPEMVSAMMGMGGGAHPVFVHGDDDDVAEALEDYDMMMDDDADDGQEAQMWPHFGGAARHWRSRGGGGRGGRPDERVRGGSFSHHGGPPRHPRGRGGQPWGHQKQRRYHDNQRPQHQQQQRQQHHQALSKIDSDAMMHMHNSGKSFDFIANALSRPVSEVIREFNRRRSSDASSSSAPPSDGGNTTGGSASPKGAAPKATASTASAKPSSSSSEAHTRGGAADAHRAAEARAMYGEAVPEEVYNLHMRGHGPNEVHYVELDDHGRPLRGTRRTIHRRRGSYAGHPTDVDYDDEDTPTPYSGRPIHHDPARGGGPMNGGDDDDDEASAYREAAAGPRHHHHQNRQYHSFGQQTVRPPGHQSNPRRSPQRHHQNDPRGGRAHRNRGK